MDYHVQCALSKPSSTGQRGQIAWIPAKHAKIGGYVKLRDEDGSWEDGWRVDTVGLRMPSKFIQERGQDYKNMKKMTDI